MVQLVALHVTYVTRRESIRARGLLGAQPTKARPFGVYVFRDDGSLDHNTIGSHRIHWSSERGSDTWQAVYCGPVMPDRYIVNGIILLEDVPPSDVSLVTGNKRG